MTKHYNGAVKLLDDRTKKEYFWHIRCCEKSSLSQTAYCEQHNLNKHTFSYLRSKYLQEQKSAEGHEADGFTELKPKTSPARIASARDVFSIYFPSGMSVELPLGLSSGTYDDIFQALGLSS